MTKKALTDYSDQREQDGGQALGPLERLAARSLSCFAATAGPVPDWRDDSLERVAVLRLQDLVADEKGEIMITADGGLRTIVLEADAHVVSRGMVPEGCAGNENLCGNFSFLSLDTGTTLYFSADVEVLVTVAKS